MAAREIEITDLKTLVHPEEEVVDEGGLVITIINSGKGGAGVMVAIHTASRGVTVPTHMDTRAIIHMSNIRTIVTIEAEAEYRLIKPLFFFFF